jgi:hypothetical protein
MQQRWEDDLPSGFAAIIQRVNPDGSCRLWVFGDEAVYLEVSVEQGKGPGQWQWPIIDLECEHGKLTGVQSPVDEGA